MYRRLPCIRCNPGRIRSLPDLVPGERHEALSEVQNYLKRYGYLDVAAREIRCVLCGETVKALKLFQRRFSLEETGRIDAVTRERMAAPRCGNAEILEPLFAARGSWNRRDLAYAFGNLSRQVGPQQAMGAVRSAFETWNQAQVGLDFREVPIHGSPDILVEWRPSNDPDHTMVGGVIAHSDYPPGFSVIVDRLPLPVHFDDEEHGWSIGASAGAYDVETVALHEIGHCLGMVHSSVSGAIMFSTIDPGYVQHDLHSDDLAGIRALYPEPRIRAPVATYNGYGGLELFAIAVDASVQHIQQIGGGEWSGWTKLGGLVKQIAVERRLNGRLELFAIGMDNALWTISQAESGGGWSEWKSLGGRVLQIAAERHNDGRLEIFAIGADGAVWSIARAEPDGEWSDWTSLGGQAIRIATERNATGSLDVFAIGTDGALWNISQREAGGGWSDWKSLSGQVKLIVPQRNVDGRLEVFAVGAGDSLWVISQDRPGGGWSGWNRLGGIVSEIAVERGHDGHLEVFAVGLDRSLWKISRTQPAGGWGDWKRLGGLVSQIAAERTSDGRIEVFVVGSDSALWNISEVQPGAGWSDWRRLA